MTECYSIGNYTETKSNPPEGEMCMEGVCFTVTLLTDNYRVLCLDDGCLLVAEQSYLDGYFTNSSMFWVETTPWNPLVVVPFDTPADIKTTWDQV